MALPTCETRGCRFRADWVLRAGYDTGRGRYLCAHHWREIHDESRVQADCYTRLETTAAPLTGRIIRANH